MGDLPPGVSSSDIPGNRPEDIEFDLGVEQIEEGLKRILRSGASKDQALEQVEETLDRVERAVEREEFHNRAVESYLLLRDEPHVREEDIEDDILDYFDNCRACDGSDGSCLECDGTGYTLPDPH